MTLRQQAHTLIDGMSDRRIRFIIDMIQRMEPELTEDEEDAEQRERMKALEELESFRKRAHLYFPKDFDYEAARAEAMEEKYGSFT